MDVAATSASRRGPQRLRAHPRDVLDTRATRRRRATARSRAREGPLGRLRHGRRGVPTHGRAGLMTLALRASTEAGAQLCALADVADDLAGRAAAHDRAGSFPHASSDALREAGSSRRDRRAARRARGRLAARPPRRLRAARGRRRLDRDRRRRAPRRGPPTWSASCRSPSTAATAGGRRRAREGARVARHARRRSLAGRDQRAQPGPLRPSTHRDQRRGRLAHRRAEDLLHGGAAATTLYASVTYTDAAGAARYGYAMVPVRARGVTIHDRIRDALGMRRRPAATP